MLRWRLTSIILKIDAPRPAAEVRKPERSEWPAKRLGSSPTRRALALTRAGAALRGRWRRPGRRWRKGRAKPLHISMISRNGVWLGLALLVQRRIPENSAQIKNY